jgi:hypothetical protein
MRIPLQVKQAIIPFLIGFTGVRILARYIIPPILLKEFDILSKGVP